MRETRIYSADSITRVPASSANIIESKSMKLYLNSFSMTNYVAESDVAQLHPQLAVGIERQSGAAIDRGPGADAELRIEDVS